MVQQVVIGWIMRESTIHRHIQTHMYTSNSDRSRMLGPVHLSSPRYAGQVWPNTSPYAGGKGPKCSVSYSYQIQYVYDSGT